MFFVEGIPVNVVWVAARMMGFISLQACSKRWNPVTRFTDGYHSRKVLPFCAAPVSGFGPTMSRGGLHFPPSLTSSILGVLAYSRETYKGI